jgi:hypothetical protein
MPSCFLASIDNGFVSSKHDDKECPSLLPLYNNDRKSKSVEEHGDRCREWKHANWNYGIQDACAAPLQYLRKNVMDDAALVNATSSRDMALSTISRDVIVSPRNTADALYPLDRAHERKRSSEVFFLEVTSPPHCSTVIRARNRASAHHARCKGPEEELRATASNHNLTYHNH